MRFKFDANQEFQVAAIEAVTGVLDGQPRIEANLAFGLGGGFAAIPNRLDLDEPTLLENLRKMQAQNGIAPDDELRCIELTIETVAGAKAARFPNFSVEMETGTGKTYVYLRTALDLFRRFALRKFIVVVPSVAIREGVLKTLEVTWKHLHELYENAPYRYSAYDSENLSQVRQFALSDGVEIMVMTIDSFNKASNVIVRPTDRLQGETPIHLVQATRPILILDEPQNMESELRVQALASLDPLFAIRYSATHRNPYNVVYRLTPYDAYRQGLVKRIEVAGVEKESDANQVFARLDGIDTQNNTITARVAVHKLMAKGAVKEKVITVRPGDSLEEKTGRSEYAGFAVDEINPGHGFVRFANNIEIKVGESRGADKEAIFEGQIRYTIHEHFDKQRRLQATGIKVLSLFFIDRVDNYAREDGIIRRLFNRCFNELKTGYEEWGDVTPETVQAAYFAQRGTKTGEIILEDSTTGEAEKDKEAYDLIMKDKELLLAFPDPADDEGTRRKKQVSFIFSHSALREGWDNPNIFQICTLNQTSSEVKKRQEVGRGVRLCVNQTGARVHDEKVNVLTVVANESYHRYVASLQSEIAFEYRSEIEARFGKSIEDLTDEERRKVEEEFGQGILPPLPGNARKRGVARLRKEYTLRPEFKELWERIKHKTRYAVRIDTEKLLGDVLPEIERADIRPPQVTVTKAQVQVIDKGMFDALQMTGTKKLIDLAGRLPLPNLVEIMANLMEHTTPPVRLTRRTLLEVFRRMSDKSKKAAMDNPHEFATVAVRVLKEKVKDHLVSGIQYERINEWYEMRQIDDEIESWQEYLVPADRSLYDHVPFQSKIERDFIKGLESRDDVKLYIRLPRWFTVPTPVGQYNPDWAIVMEDRDEHAKRRGMPLLYLVRETKSTTNLLELSPEERRKIQCGKQHFESALGVSFRVVTTASSLP